MSRIGRLPIAIPAGVTVTVDDTNLVTVKGPKGENSYRANTAMQVTVEDGTVKVARPDDSKENRALHGLTRTLIATRASRKRCRSKASATVQRRTARTLS